MKVQLITINFIPLQRHTNTTMDRRAFKAALFDLDGVVFDTEPQYTIFWRQEARRYHPEISDLEYLIKGQTLTQIYDGFFADVADEQAEITRRLNEYEQCMEYDYVSGFQDFIVDLRKQGIKTAIVTSSNLAKMQNVYRQHPEFKTFFDAILTSEDFRESKPSPDCYLTGISRLDSKSVDSIVLEDSFNGLKSGRASGAFVIALATSNPREALTAYADHIIDNFQGLTAEKVSKIIVTHK